MPILRCSSCFLLLVLLLLLRTRGSQRVLAVQVVPVPIDDLLSKEYAKKRRSKLYSPGKVMPLCPFLSCVQLRM
jgi:hypothetical protein